MIANGKIALCLAAALASSACGTKPRTFSATVQPTGPAAAPAGEAQAFSTCDQLVRSGHKGNFAAVAASGAATGATLMGGGAALAASGTIGIGATAAGAVMAVALPFVGIAAGFGVNRMIRSGKERKYQRTMTACMGELGYEVIDWSRAPKRQPGTAVIGDPIPAVIEEGPAAAPVDQVASVN